MFSVTSKAIWFPIFVLVVISLVNASGLASVGGLATRSSIGGSGLPLYDSSGVLIYYGNLTCARPNPSSYSMFEGDKMQGTNSLYAYFHNDTYVFNLIDPQFKEYVDWELYTDTGGAVPAQWAVVGGFGSVVYGYDTSSPLGFLTLIGVLLVFVAVIGLNILGSGDNETATNAIFKGTAWLAFWVMFSAYALSVLSELTLNGFNVGLTIYSVLTLIYCIGIVDSVGHPTGSGL